MIRILFTFLIIFSFNLSSSQEAETLDDLARISFFTDVVPNEAIEGSAKSNLIKKLDKIVTKNNEFIFHAGTKKINDKIFSNGGRVLNFVVRSKNFIDSRKKAISLINDLEWENGFFRKDIGFKVID